MKFTRTKKMVFFNNKGGVGKTTLAYNTAVKFAENGYKTVLIDLDPQCNLSLLAMGDYFIQKHLLPNEGDIYTVLKKVVEGGGDIDTSVKFEKIGPTGNLFLLPGSSNLSQYENSLITSWGEAAIGQERGFFSTSAISRFLDQKALSEEIDIFIIDTSPTLGLLNRVIFLDSHYFVTPRMPDAFSIQGIRNLGNIFSEWRENWKVTSKVLAKNKEISSDKVLDGESLFIGYTINSYNQYSQQPIKANREWMELIPQLVKENISEKFYHFLKFTEEEMLLGFDTKEKIKNDWFGKYKTGISDFCVGAERIVYSLFNGKGIGQPNSSPVGSDLFFEVDDAYIHIDLKTVMASLKGKTNINDYLKFIPVGNNQNSYNGKLDVGKREKIYKNANLPHFYNLEKGIKKVCLTYFITILYDKDSLSILNINLLSMPNGQLFGEYGKNILQAGKTQTGLSKKERKIYCETLRYKWSKSIDFKLLENKKRIKVVYFDKNMDKTYTKKLNLINEIYKSQK